MTERAAEGEVTTGPEHRPALAGFSDEVATQRTGRSWREWVARLDAAGACEMTHREIARHVAETSEGVSGWLAQAVTVGYERIRRLREVGQRRTGSYEASRSRTLPVAAASRDAARPPKRAPRRPS